MYNVLIIDDEPMIREGLSSIVNWNELGCTVCATAENAEDGAEKIKLLRPDIIITDIKMDNMSGLDMLYEMHEYTLNSQIIIITGYRNFDYAATAIELGVSSFLLKPLKLPKLEQAITKATDSLGKLRSSSTPAESSINEDIEAAFRKAAVSDGNAYEILSEYNIPDNEYVAISMKCDTGDGDISAENIKYYVNLLMHDIADVYSIENENNIFSFLLISNERRLNKSVFLQNLSAIQAVILKDTEKSYSVSFSDISSDYSRLKEKYKESMRAITHNVYTGGSSIIPYAVSKIFFENDYDNITIDTLPSQLLNIVTTGAAEALPKCIQHIGYIFEKTADLDLLKNKCHEIISYLFSINSALDNSRFTLDSVYMIIDNASSYEELLMLISMIANDLTHKIDSYNNKSLSSKLNKAIAYIKNNIGGQITLSDVSEAIGLSPNYVSAVFKKELNKRFSDYITETRIEFAKTLLKSDEYKIYEISDQVGISDSLYFSKLFKKHTGFSPSQYREHWRKENKE